ncbi:MAG: nuclear transport factor 2 family protein [Chloroflexi bacterium]|nr:nuclear transport factor 2 family protein [Chloroflexota bacterium]
MTDPDFAAGIAAAFQAFNERRFADFATYVTDDVVEIYPQSGERFEGRDRQQAFHEAFPNPPIFTVRNVLRSGDLAVVEVDEQYPDGTVWEDVWILQLRNGLVASMTGYFGQPFPAPEWRRRYRAEPAGQ